MKKRRLKQRNLYWSGIMVALASFSILGARLIAAPTTFIVNSVADSADPAPGDGICGPTAGPCTLRAAIEESNANTGADTIAFNISGAGVKTIVPASPLPVITDAVLIDGYTQPGASVNTLARGTNAVLRIEVSGASLPANNLLIVNGTGSTLRGLIINRSQFNNLELRTGGGHIIEGCFIGTNAEGSGFAGASATSNNGVTIFSDNNLIGGPSLAARNLISGINDEAIYVGGANTTLQNNLIGTSASGTAPIANGTGVRLGGFEFNAATTSPSDTRVLGNVISGSMREGIQIFPNAGGVTVTDTTIQGNLIGLSASGTAAIANGGGIFVDSSDNPFPENTGGPVTGVQIGGTEVGQGNVISGNTNVGISIANPVKVTGVVIQGNTIGLIQAGTAALGNGNSGIVANTSGVLIGGAIPQARNVISGNGFRGIEFGGTSNLTIQNNFIGTNRAGTAALGNGSDGIRGGVGNNTAVNITIENNVISGNGFNTTGSGSPDGIHIQNSGRPTSQVTAPFIRLRGNIIGLDASGTTDLGNRGFGLTINQSTNVSLDSTSSSAAERNIISGNDGGGIHVFESSGNQIQGNLIGLAADESTLRGNGGDGITVVGNNSGNTLIGAASGTQAGGNRIAGNSGHGVSTNAPSGIRINGNAIFENGALGINLIGGANESPQGVTPNDGDDSDTGPNALQNFPEFTFVNASGSNIRAFGELRSLPDTTYRLEFYTSQAPDPIGFGEGQTFLGAEDVTTNEFGAASFEVTFSDTGGPFLTATATDPNGNTSEFSPAFVAATLTPESATSPVRTQHTVTATLLVNNLLQANVTVNFSIVSGPNEGAIGTATTDAQGEATFTYTGTGGAGTDNIRASGNFGIIPFAAIAGKTWTEAVSLPTLSINDVTITEGNNGTSDAVFTITLSRAVNTAVTVNFATRDNEAFAPDDFTAQDRVVSIDAGETTATVTVPVIGDVIDESGELFTVVLTNPQGATLLRAEGNGTIVDNDTSTLSINDVSLREGNNSTTTFTFTASLSNPSAVEVSVNFATSDGTATAGSDYVARTGTLTFPAGTTTRQITVTVNGDTDVEPDEIFTVNLSNPNGATITDGVGTGTITNDDTTQPTLSINDVTVTEGNSRSTPATFTVRLSAASNSSVTVNVITADSTTSNNSATAGSDYTATTGILTFDPGVLTQTFTVPILGDTQDEVDEIFLVNLSTPANATIADGQGISTILDDDAPPTLSVNDVRVTEGDAGTTNAIFAVTLSASSSQMVSVNVATSNNTAIADTDYTAVVRMLTIPAGTQSVTILVPVIGDTSDETDESFFINLSTPVNATIADGQGIATIVDDDVSPSLAINDVRVIEGDNGSTQAIFTVSFSAASGRSVAVSTTTANGTAVVGSDYNAVSRTFTIPAGTRSVTVVVPVIGDTANEPDETFFVDLSAPVNATIERARGVGTIADDDAPPATLGPIDVTPQTNIASGNIVPYPYLPDLFRPTQFRQVVTLRNISGAPTTGPVTAILANLNSGVTLTNANGVTTTVQPLGSPFVYVNVGADNVWRPDEVVTVTLDFNAPSADVVSYNLLVFARWTQISSPASTPSATSVPQPDNSVFNVSGRVASGFGFGLSGLQVTLSGNGRNKSTMTVNNGEYSFGDLPVGTYTITPHFSGLNFSPPSRTLTVGPGYRKVDFFGYFGTAPASPPEPEPIGPAPVAMPTNTPEPIPTPARTATPTPTTSGGATPTPTVTPIATPTPTATPTRPTAEQGFAVSGRITTSTGFGLRGISVTITDSVGINRSGQTDNNGVFFFGDLPPGVYTATPSYSGLRFTPPSRTAQVQTSDVFELNFIARL